MPWTTFDDVIKADRKRGVTLPLHGNTTGTLTAAGVNSGGLSIIPLFGAAGTTLWSTFKGFPLPPGIDATTDWRALWAKNGSTRIGGYWVALFYKIGTVDLTSTGEGGRRVSDIMGKAGIELNANAIPFDPRKPFDPSGLRIGLAAITSRGVQAHHMPMVADLIEGGIKLAAGTVDEARCVAHRARVREFLRAFPAPGL